MNKYQKELATFRFGDEIQDYSFDPKDEGYAFIPTAGHGYLVVPVEDRYYEDARKIASFGYQGDHAVYLEEDCEAGEFLEKVRNNRFLDSHLIIGKIK